VKPRAGARCRAGGPDELAWGPPAGFNPRVGGSEQGKNATIGRSAYPWLPQKAVLALMAQRQVGKLGVHGVGHGRAAAQAATTG
jgi:hypothetical protein